MSKSKADVRERFQKQVITAGKETANKQKESLLNQGQRPWYVIDLDGWDGLLVGGTKEMGEPFSREEHKDDIAEIYKIDEEDGSGMVGDMVISALQADCLGTQERAFRSRHGGRVRASCQAAARRYGHGHEAGVLERGVMGYIQGISELSKEARE